MSTAPWPRGVVTALVTPMRDDELSVDSLERLIERQIDSGVAGLVIGGGTGEFGALTLDERRLLVEQAVTIAAGRIPIIAQTGTLATRDSIALSRHAQDVGAFGLLIASPFGEPINWDERLRFYEHVTASVELPIMIYNTPPAGLLTLGQIQQLAGLPNVSAVKDSSGDPALLGDLLTAAGCGLQVYVGMDCLVFEAISAGASGAIFGVPNFMPEPLTRIVALLQSGDRDAATELWRDIRPFLRFMEHCTNYMALCKVGCTVDGIDVGDVRAPYLMPTDEERDEFTRRLDQLKAAVSGEPVFAR